MSISGQQGELPFGPDPRGHRNSDLQGATSSVMRAKVTQPGPLGRREGAGPGGRSFISKQTVMILCEFCV